MPEARRQERREGAGGCVDTGETEGDSKNGRKGRGERTEVSEQYPIQDFLKDFQAIRRAHASLPINATEEEKQINLVMVLQVKYPPGDLLAFRGELLFRALHTFLSARDELLACGLLTISPDKTEHHEGMVVAALHELIVQQGLEASAANPLLKKTAQRLIFEFRPEKP